MLCVSAIINIVHRSLCWGWDRVSSNGWCYLTADAVVAINGVWILVETYTLNSKIICSPLKQCSRRCVEKCCTPTEVSPLSHTCPTLQVDFPRPDLSPGLTLCSWPVSLLLLCHMNTKQSLLHLLWNWSFVILNVLVMALFLSLCFSVFSLWCRSVTENFRFGANGLFQLRMEPVSNNWMRGQSKTLYLSDQKLWDSLIIRETYK